MTEVRDRPGANAKEDAAVAYWMDWRGGEWPVTEGEALSFFSGLLKAVEEVPPGPAHPSLGSLE